MLYPPAAAGPPRPVAARPGGAPRGGRACWPRCSRRMNAASWRFKVARAASPASDDHASTSRAARTYGSVGSIIGMRCFAIVAPFAPRESLAHCDGSRQDELAGKLVASRLKQLEGALGVPIWSEEAEGRSLPA